MLNFSKYFSSFEDQKLQNLLESRLLHHRWDSLAFTAILFVNVSSSSLSDLTGGDISQAEHFQPTI